MLAARGYRAALGSMRESRNPQPLRLRSHALLIEDDAWMLFRHEAYDQINEAVV